MLVVCNSITGSSRMSELIGFEKVQLMTCANKHLKAFLGILGVSRWYISTIETCFSCSDMSFGAAFSKVRIYPRFHLTENRSKGTSSHPAWADSSLDVVVSWEHHGAHWDSAGFEQYLEAVTSGLWTTDNSITAAADL